MDEPAVFGHVVDELDSRGYQPLVHVPGAHEKTYADVLDRCESHQITIGGRYPDVLGFTNADRVFAVEVKGSSGLLRGIGQALTYQQGAHVSYLAAAVDVVTQHTDLPELRRECPFLKKRVLRVSREGMNRRTTVQTIKRTHL